MAAFNLADSYRAAGITVGPETLRLRQEPFDKLRKDITPSLSTDLVRAYFGLPARKELSWLRDPFHATDSSFSLVDNERELAVLAASLLSASIEDGKLYSALALFTTCFDALRMPTVIPELLSKAEGELTSRSIAQRQRERPNLALLRLPPKSKVPAETAGLAQQGDWAKAATLLKQVSDESFDGVKNVAQQCAAIFQPLMAEVDDLREEVEFLWWHIGGWSRVLETPFSELKPALAAAMIGLDAADLSRTRTGPAAAPAIILRTLGSGKGAKVSMAEGVNAFPLDRVGELDIDANTVNSSPEVFPVLAAFLKASEVGEPSAWEGAYRKFSSVDPAREVTAGTLALQMFRERLLVGAFSV